MYLRIITGRAGTGKTFKCLAEIGREIEWSPLGAPLVLLVPEQASFETERALSRAVGAGGFMRVQVLGFRRLAYRVLQETGGATRIALGEMSKRMILRRMLEQRAGELHIFGRAAGMPGFLEKLAGTLGELKAYRIRPQDIERCLKDLNNPGGAGLLPDKLHDLRAVYADFEQFLHNRFVDPDDYLNLAAEKVQHSAWLRGARIWVDGFTGFTPLEYGLLAQMLRHTRGVTVTLCLDADLTGRVLPETDPFYPVWETYTELVNTAHRDALPVRRVSVAAGDSPRRFAARDLACLEKNLFNRRSAGQDGEVEGVMVMAAADRLAEVEGMAREIVRLCREQGYRWRDIVVLLREMEQYAGLIEVVFNDHGIPFFIDHKRTIMHHPLVETIRAALETVLEGWTVDPVFRYLKTDLVPVTREEIDILENYVLAHGIRGDRWIDGQPWKYGRRLVLEVHGAGEPDELDEHLVTVNKIREAAVAELARLHRSLLDGGTAAEYTRALYGLLQDLSVPEQLERWGAAARQAGKLELAREHEQVWEGIAALLDEVVEALGDDQMNLREYARILDAGLAAIRLGLIPPGLDQVVVGSLDRSRTPEVRAAFIPGVNEGVLPARFTEQGIFTEPEREQLDAAGLRLAPGARRLVFDEQHVIYRAVTRAGERLVISYPLADSEGRALKPSPVIHRMREIFPGLAEGLWAREPGLPDTDDLDFIATPGRSLTYLAGKLREAAAGRDIDPLWWDVYNWFARSGDSRFAGVIGSLFFTNREESLPRRLGRRLYGRRFKTGISGLEKFRACPFSHFLAQGLRLKERAVFKLDTPDTGEFFHAALKLFAQRLVEGGADWGGISREQCSELAGEVVESLAPRLQSEILLSSARHRYIKGKLKRVVQRSALVLSEHARRGSFRPVGLELAFGPGGALPGVTFSLGGGAEMVLTGRIDRVDAAENGGQVYLRIIDYKSGVTTIRLSEIFHGLKLQLLTYLDVALHYARELAGAEGLPGAVLYFRIDEPLVLTDGTPLGDEEVERRLLQQLKMKGLLLAEPELVRMMDDRVGATSDLLPVGIKKDGGFSARSAVLSRERFDLLRSYIRHQLVSAGRDILAGVKDISPYRQGGFRACRHCSYKPVCKFDPLLPGNAFRVISPEKDEVIWQRIKERLGVGENE